VLEFDRTKLVDVESGLDYRVVTDWAVAEHKSQGALPSSVRGEDLERYYEFAVNDERGVARAEALFGRLGRLDSPSDEGRTDAGERPPRWNGVCLNDR
jgi:hypothetical protein